MIKNLLEMMDYENEETENPNGEPSQDEVLVQGVGRYRRSQVMDNVRGKLQDLLQRAESNNPEDWKQMASLMEKGTLQAFITAAASEKYVHDEPQGETNDAPFVNNNTNNSEDGVH